MLQPLDVCLSQDVKGKERRESRISGCSNSHSFILDLIEEVKLNGVFSTLNADIYVSTYACTCVCTCLYLGIYSHFILNFDWLHRGGRNIQQGFGNFVSVD